MTIFVLAITVRLWDRQTGLKWYPAALADQLALFRNSDTLAYFAQVEWKGSFDALADGGFDGMNFRLGYWALTPIGSVDEEIWYGVGVIDPGKCGCTPFSPSD